MTSSCASTATRPPTFRWAPAAIAQLREQWRLPQGETFTQSRWTQAKNTAIAQLAAGGYAATKITASEAFVDPDELAADLSVTLDSGPLFHFGELSISGLKRYPPGLCCRSARWRRGQRYDQQTLDQFVRRLNATGYFASVQATVDADPAHADDAPVNIAVIEAPTKRIDTGIGYSTDTRFRANASYRDVDVDGHARQLAIDARLEQKLSSLSTRLTAPPNDRGWTDSVLAQVERTDIENLVTETAVAGVRRQGLDERDNWNFGAAYYFDRQSPQGADQVTSHALYVDAVRTWRRTDDLIAPTRGFNVALQTGVGVPGVSTRGFGRVIAQFVAWHPLTRNLDLSLRADAGAVLANSRDGIPSTLLFRTGGDTTRARLRVREPGRQERRRDRPRPLLRGGERRSDALAERQPRHRHVRRRRQCGRFAARPVAPRAGLWRRRAAAHADRSIPPRPRVRAGRAPGARAFFGGARVLTATPPPHRRPARTRAWRCARWRGCCGGVRHHHRRCCWPASPISPAPKADCRTCCGRSRA